MKTPPKFLLWLLDVVSPGSRPDLKGDFQEIYELRLQQMSKRHADWEFLKDIITIIPLKVIVKQHHQPPINMFSTNLKIARRNLVKNKLYSIINVSGLAISLAACILIALFVKDELSFDKHFANSEDVYRIAGNYDHGGPARILAAPTTFMLLPMIDGNLKNVEKITRAEFRWETITVSMDGEQKQFLEPHIIYGDSTFFDVFTIPFANGDIHSALDDPSSVVVDRQTAVKYFGTANAIGKQVRLKDKVFSISAVIENMPSNSHFVGNLIFPIQGIKQWYQDWVMTNPSGTSLYTYIKGAEGLNIAETESTINKIFAKHWGEKPPTFFLQPLGSIHLESNLQGEIAENGNKVTVYIFATIAVIILILAGINYINLSTAGSLQRVKEVGMKRVFGSTTRMQVAQFQTESFIVVISGAAIALLMTCLALPFFNIISGKAFGWEVITDPAMLVSLLIVILFIALISGSFPALTLLRHKTIAMLSGSVGFNSTKSYFRNGLIIFQFAITITLITSTLIVMSQMSFIRNKDLGMNPDQVLLIPLETVESGRKYEQLRTEMMRSSLVLNVSASSNKVTGGIGGWRPYNVTWQKEPLNIPTICVSPDFFETMGANVLQGRGFSIKYPSDAKDAYVINESAAKFLKLDNPLGAPLIGATFTGSEWFEKNAHIIGVVKDIHFGSLHSQPGPLVFNVGSEITETYGWIEVKIAGSDMHGAVTYLDNLWKTLVPDAPFQFEFMDESLQNSYQAEERFLKVFGTFSILSILLGCLGLFGLTAFMTKRRTKEIGIRKIVGASTPRLIGLLSGDFLKLVLISNLIGWPLAYYLMYNWLQNFAYRTTISPLLFIGTGAAAVAIAFGAILFHALQSAKANPVTALRYE
jgi:putative ABC transport system permease protein